MTNTKLTAAQVTALRTAIDAGQVYAGYNPGYSTVNAGTITALGRAGFLAVSKVDGNICGTVTQAGVAAYEQAR